MAEGKLKMKKSRAGRKPNNGSRAMTDAERQGAYRKRKKLEATNAAKNIGGAATATLWTVFQHEAKKIELGEIDDRTLMRKIIVEICNRHEIPIENVEEDVGGLIDIDEDAVEEILERPIAKRRLERVEYLISIRQSELDAVSSELESERAGICDQTIQELQNVCACEELLLELLYTERSSISSRLYGD